MRRRIGTALGAAALLATLIAPAAMAGSGTNACWGVVTSQRASTTHDMGTHSSSFAGEPRLGLGNVARLLLGEDASVGELGALLASLDGLDATHCP